MRSFHRLALLVTAGTVFAVCSCSSGSQSPSGFLSNYKQLNAGFGTADAVATYVKPGVDFNAYDSVILDPVTTVVAAPGLSPAVCEQLAVNLGNSLASQIGGSFKIVSSPSPTTLRIRTALTDVIEGQQGGIPTATVHSAPHATLTGAIGSEAVAAFISHVAFEGEILDSQTGERLAALIDHRLGVKRDASAATSWAAVRSALDQAVIRLRDRFLAVRAS
jgi:hypothetical protein